MLSQLGCGLTAQVRLLLCWDWGKLQGGLRSKAQGAFELYLQAEPIQVQLSDLPPLHGGEKWGKETLEDRTENLEQQNHHCPWWQMYPNTALKARVGPGQRTVLERGDARP